MLFKEKLLPFHLTNGASFPDLTVLVASCEKVAEDARRIVNPGSSAERVMASRAPEEAVS